MVTKSGALTGDDRRQVWEPGETQSMNSCAKTKIDEPHDPMIERLDKMFKEIERLLRTQIIAKKRHRILEEIKDQHDPIIERMEKGF